MNLLGFVDRATRDVDVLARVADQTGPGSVHVTDLIALVPTAGELAAAAEWVRTQDTSSEFHAVVNRVIAYVRQQRA